MAKTQTRRSRKQERGFRINSKIREVLSKCAAEGIDQHEADRRAVAAARTADLRLTIREARRRVADCRAASAPYATLTDVEAAADIEGLTNDPHLTRLLVAAQRRARSQGKACSLTRAEIAALYVRQGGRCSLSGIPFSRDEVVGNLITPRPFAASIDRIRAGGDYTPDNVRLVCWIANIAMGQWGDQPLVRLAQGIVAHCAPVQGHGERDSSVGPVAPHGHQP